MSLKSTRMHLEETPKKEIGSRLEHGGIKYEKKKMIIS